MWVSSDGRDKDGEVWAGAGTSNGTGGSQGRDVNQWEDGWRMLAEREGGMVREGPSRVGTRKARCMSALLTDVQNLHPRNPT